MKSAAESLPEGMVKRGNTYHADFCVAGRRTRKALSRNLKTARQLLAELRARAERGEYGLIDNRCKLAEMARDYLAEVKQTKRPNTHRAYAIRLDEVLPHLPADAAHLHPDQITRYRDGRLTDACGSSINATVTTLKTMLNWAVETGRIGSNPLARVKRLRYEAQGARALKPEEVAALLAKCPEPWREIWYAYASTGLRRNELAYLTARDVDWDCREIVVTAHRAKSHRERRIPMDDALYMLLKEKAADRAPGEPLLLSPTGATVDTSNPSPRLRRHCKLAGVDPHRVTLHSLRKAFATALILAQVDPKTVQQLLGHATLEMTMKIYAEVFPTTRRQAIGRLPWGAGASDPEHLVGFKLGHKTVTKEKEAVASA